LFFGGKGCTSSFLFFDAGIKDVRPEMMGIIKYFGKILIKKNKSVKRTRRRQENNNSSGRT
jgi:hypothetical protein